MSEDLKSVLVGLCVFLLPIIIGVVLIVNFIKSSPDEAIVIGVGTGFLIWTILGVICAIFCNPVVWLVIIAFILISK